MIYRISIACVLAVLLNLFQGASGQDATYDTLANDPDLEERESVGWFVHGRKPGEYREIKDELQFLEFILQFERHSPLVTGKHEINGTLAFERFVPILKKTKVISEEIAAKRKRGLSDREKSQLTADVLDRIAELLPERSIKAMRQCEVFANGPVRYFHREDVRTFYDLQPAQLDKISETAMREGSRHAAYLELAQAKLNTNAFVLLDGKQRTAAEKVLGLPEETIAALYQDLPEKDLALISRFDFSGLTQARNDGREQEYLAEYSEEIIDVLFSSFSSLRRNSVRESLSLDEGAPVTHFRIATGVKFAPQILTAMRQLWNDSGQPLSKTQEKEFDLMMNGTEEVDGIVLKGTASGLGSYRVLTGQRLRRKLQPFADSLTAGQQQIARDALLLMFGPNRILLSKSVAKELEISSDQQVAILKNALSLEEEFEEYMFKSRMTAFAAVLGELSPEQRQQLSERVGLQMEELARRYSSIREETFRVDFPADALRK